jgi:hypothetical protein
MTAHARDLPDWFAAQLGETVEWCQDRADIVDPEHCLRSSELQPELGPYDGSVTALWVNSEMIEGVVQRRKQLLRSRGWSGSNDLTAAMRGGRLLLCAYEYTNHNGATAGDTSGFFDDHDVPPWDTWVGEVAGLPGRDPPGTWGGTWPPTLRSTLSMGKEPPHNGLLVCWIPPAFIDAGQRALAVECVGMVCWAGEPIESGGAGPRLDHVVPEWLVRFAAGA